MGYGINAVLALFGGFIVLGIFIGITFLVSLVVANRAGVDISHVTDLSNAANVQEKVGQVKTMLEDLRSVFIKIVEEMKSRMPIFSNILTAKGISIVCFSLMLFFGIIPLKFAYGFIRVDFGVLWLLQVILLVVFALAFSQKYFQLLIVPIGTYFFLAVLSWPIMIIRYNKYGYSGVYAFKYATSKYWSFSGTVFLVTMLAIIGVFVLTYFVKKFKDTKPLILTCLVAVPVNYLAMCISYGGLIRSFLMAFDCSIWMFIAFIMGIISLVLSQKAVEQHQGINIE